MSILSERLQEAIELRGMSQKRLAEEAGTSESNVSRYLGDNRNPRSTQIVVDMAVALKVSTDFLFGLTNLPNGVESIGADEKFCSHATSAHPTTTRRCCGRCSANT